MDGHISRVLRAAAAGAILGLVLAAAASGAVPDPAPATPTAATVSGAPATASAGTPRQSIRPNIVVMMADDMRASDLPYVPRTRQYFARHGITFTNMISQHPLCCPARAEFLTGQLAQNNGVRTNNAVRLGGYKRLRTGRTIATWLRSAGYQTAFFGKHLNGYYWERYHRDPGWQRFHPLTSGVYDYFGWSVVGNKGPVHYPRRYVTEYIGTSSAAAIRSMHRSRAPFFLWVSHVAPHGAYYPATRTWGPPKSNARYAGQFADAPLDSMRKPSFNEPDVSDKPRIMRIRPPAVAHLLRLHRARIRSLRAMDDENAKVIRALADTGELANTLLVFTSDNGFMLGEHRWQDKVLGYEESLRVPLMASGPGIPPATRTSSTATILDLPATFLDAAAATPTLRIDGVSLLPLMRHPGRPRPGDTLLIQGGPRGPKEVRWGWLYRGVRTARYTYIRFGNGEHELYDRRLDPYELTNVASDGTYRPVRREMLRRLKLLVGCSGAAACNRTFGPDPSPRSPR